MFQLVLWDVRSYELTISLHHQCLCGLGDYQFFHLRCERKFARRVAIGVYEVVLQEFISLIPKIYLDPDLVSKLYLF